jgi:hypothetical protein
VAASRAGWSSSRAAGDRRRRPYGDARDDGQPSEAGLIRGREARGRGSSGRSVMRCPSNNRWPPSGAVATCSGSRSVRVVVGRVGTSPITRRRSVLSQAGLAVGPRPPATAVQSSVVPAADSQSPRPRPCGRAVRCRLTNQAWPSPGTKRAVAAARQRQSLIKRPRPAHEPATARDPRPCGQ